MNELDLKYAETEAVPGLLCENLGVFQQAALVQLQLDDGVGQGRGVNGDVQIGDDIGDGADVILMPVGDDDAPDFADVGLEIADVRNNHVDAVHILVRETHAAVHHDDVVAVLIGGHVLANLAKTAQRDNLQFGLTARTLLRGVGGALLPGLAAGLGLRPGLGRAVGRPGLCGTGLRGLRLLQGLDLRLLFRVGVWFVRVPLAAGTGIGFFRCLLIFGGRRIGVVFCHNSSVSKNFEHTNKAGLYAESKNSAHPDPTL